MTELVTENGFYLVIEKGLLVRGRVLADQEVDSDPALTEVLQFDLKIEESGVSGIWSKYVWKGGELLDADHYKTLQSIPLTEAVRRELSRFEQHLIKHEDIRKDGDKMIHSLSFLRNYEEQDQLAAIYREASSLCAFLLESCDAQS